MLDFRKNFAYENKHRKVVDTEYGSQFEKYGDSNENEKKIMSTIRLVNKQNIPNQKI